MRDLASLIACAPLLAIVRKPRARSTMTIDLDGWHPEQVANVRALLEKGHTISMLTIDDPKPPKHGPLQRWLSRGNQSGGN